MSALTFCSLRNTLPAQGNKGRDSRDKRQAVDLSTDVAGAAARRGVVGRGCLWQRCGSSQLQLRTGGRGLFILFKAILNQLQSVSRYAATHTCPPTHTHAHISLHIEAGDFS